MFPHVNLCPLLESHLRLCAETKGLITPDGPARGGGGVRGGEDRSASRSPGQWPAAFLLLVVGLFVSPLLL